MTTQPNPKGQTMTSFTLTNGTECETGCVIDGHWGNYGLSRMLEITDDLLGTTFHDEATATFALTRPTIITRNEDGTYAYEDGPLPTDPWDGFTFEFLDEIADDAESALNDATPGGFLWHWHDGEFFASPICDDDDDCEDETCAHWS